MSESAGCTNAVLRELVAHVRSTVAVSGLAISHASLIFSAIR